MRNNIKKLLAFVATATMLTSTLALSACGGSYNFGGDLEMPSSTAKVDSNGGFAVEKGGYVYFINGVEEYTADNTFGDVVKGALYRIAKSDLEENKYDKAQVVVPTLVGSQNFETGIYIYGDRVYYATPTTDKNIQGVVENSWIDFKSAKLDGSDTMKGYYFRLSTNTTNFRYVEVKDKDKDKGAETTTVYCMYEEDGALKSYNTKTVENTVLVKGADTYYFNETVPTDSNVYYTMSVSYDLDSNKATPAAYNQIYSVSADATATVNAKEASYTVTDGRTYDFDKEYLEEVNEEAKKTADEEGTDYTATYDFDDYSTYPYVNLGKLVIDGIGFGNEQITPFNDVTDVADVKENAGSFEGYTYTITRYENDGVYYTRNDKTELYYYSLKNTENTADAKVKAITANTAADVVALNTTNASASALFEYDEQKKEHQYIYLSGSNVYRATAAEDGTVEEEVKLFGGASSMTLWKTTEDGYLYYYGSGTYPVSGSTTSGYQLSRIKYNGTKEQYDPILSIPDTYAEYKPVTITYVDFASSWYMPEIIGDTLLYANAQSIGSTSYNYIYATKLGNTDIKANNEKYEETLQYFEDEFTVDLKNAATYLFRTFKDGERKEGYWFYDDFVAVQNEYKANNDGKEISWVDDLEELWNQIEADTYKVESDFINMIGAYSESDEEAVREAWQSYLPFETEEDEESGWEWWHILLLVSGCVIVVAAGVTIPLVILHKKKLQKAEEEATVNAYQRVKIDTTDDKSIDVYADDKAE